MDSPAAAPERLRDFLSVARGVFMLVPGAIVTADI
jgi:hypothetical protein